MYICSLFDPKMVANPCGLIFVPKIEKIIVKNRHEAMTTATKGMLEKSFTAIIDDKILEIENQWKEKFGAKSLERIFDNYL